MKVFKIHDKVLDFLIEYGKYPAFKKAENWQIRAERKLHRKLLKLQAGLEAEFIKELYRRGYIPSTPRERRRFVNRILMPVFNEMREVIADEYVENADTGRMIALRQLESAGLIVDYSVFTDEIKRRLWEKTYTFSERTFKRIAGNYAKTLAKGYEEGIGINEIARWLRHDFKNMRDYELKRIARTEIHGAQSEGNHETLREYNVRYKQWITAEDDRVRGNKPKDAYNHVVLHGQVVEFDEPYSNGLMYPGDRNGDIGDWINCRCVERAYIPSVGEIILTTPYYP